MIEEIWKYRARIYTALLIGLAIFTIYSYIQSAKQTQDSQFIKDFRRLNASFFRLILCRIPICQSLITQIQIRSQTQMIQKAGAI